MTRLKCVVPPTALRLGSIARNSPPEPPFMLREGVSARDSVGKPAVNLRDSAGPCSRLQDWHCPLMQVPFGCAPQPEEANGLPFVQRSLAGALKLTLSVPPP
eukprot:CAMPEP_0174296636 /NCGR_PEP_ID=MMETSP0809-20121228/48456_1 /TAXON_ID=73025 ORGANISM="Eutreptiella gymnastica-like, Strain CCMP1594" /NCGR_SAMPLE_ID=MMETSP0809 /ASSEMBLY_ACC=CAM_ASM_000658 /LENGTH=101 /DNA_ID=CAMNT_0015399767 /DNA_START=87 /DNA_END=388 /DNA_ORIENTATION=+